MDLLERKSWHKETLRYLCNLHIALMAREQDKDLELQEEGRNTVVFMTTGDGVNRKVSRDFVKLYESDRAQAKLLIRSILKSL